MSASSYSPDKIEATLANALHEFHLRTRSPVPITIIADRTLHDTTVRKSAFYLRNVYPHMDLSAFCSFLDDALMPHHVAVILNEGGDDMCVIIHARESPLTRVTAGASFPRYYDIAASSGQKKRWCTWCRCCCCCSMIGVAITVAIVGYVVTLASNKHH